MFRWLVEENLSTNAITYRLRDLGVPTPTGKPLWGRDSVYTMLRNPAYCGKTYVFTRTYGEPKQCRKPNAKHKKTGVIWKPKEEWIGIPGATPPIISQELFDAAQKKLRENQKMAPGNTKTDYLLHGHIYCARCGRSFWGNPGIKTRNGKRYRYPFYQCSGKYKKVTHHDRCDNRQHNAARLEALVWTKVEKVLSRPDLVLAELEKAGMSENVSIWERDLGRINTQIEHYEKQKDRAWAGLRYSGDEETFKQNITEIQVKLTEFEAEKAELEMRMNDHEQIRKTSTDLKRSCALVSSTIQGLSFEEKRLALRALNIRVLIDGDTIRLQGSIPLDVGSAMHIPSGLNLPDQYQEHRHAVDYPMLSPPLSTSGWQPRGVAGQSILWE